MHHNGLSSKAVAVFSGLAVGVLAGDARAVTQPFRIALVADPHVDTGIGAAQSQYEANFQSVIDNVNALGVNEVLLAADDTQNGTAAQFAKYKQMIGGFTAPTLTVAGNHDVGDKVSPGTTTTLSDTRLNTYVSNVGPLWFSQTIAPELRVVGATSSLMGSGLARETDQWNFLQQNLAPADPNEKVILLMHYPAFLNSPNEGSLYSSLEPGPRAELLNLISDSHTDLVLSGHVHRAILNTYGDATMIGVPATSFPQPSTASLGWTLLTINPDGTVVEDVRTFPLSVPEPASWGLCLIGGGWVAARRRRLSA